MVGDVKRRSYLGVYQVLKGIPRKDHMVLNESVDKIHFSVLGEILEIYLGKFFFVTKICLCRQIVSSKIIHKQTVHVHVAVYL